MANVIRGNVNLTKLSDAKLIEITDRARALFGPDRGEFFAADMAAMCRSCACRFAVGMAVTAFDYAEADLTRAEIVPASPESRAWSNLEGGHRFYVKPKAEDIMRHLMTGEPLNTDNLSVTEGCA